MEPHTPPTPPKTVAWSGRRTTILAAATLVVVALVVYFVFLRGGADYWDGGDFAGHPVSNLAGAVTKEAHDELEACGLSDEDAEDLQSPPGFDPASAGPYVIQHLDASGQPTGSITGTYTPDGVLVWISGDTSITVQQIAPGVNAWDCETS